MGTVAADTTFDDGANAASFNEGGAVCATRKTACMPEGGVDGAIDVQIADGSAPTSPSSSVAVWLKVSV